MQEKWRNGSSMAGSSCARRLWWICGKGHGWEGKGGNEVSVRKGEGSGGKGRGKMSHVRSLLRYVHFRDEDGDGDGMGDLVWENGSGL